MPVCLHQSEQSYSDNDHIHFHVSTRYSFIGSDGRPSEEARLHLSLASHRHTSISTSLSLFSLSLFFFLFILLSISQIFHVSMIPSWINKGRNIYTGMHVCFYLTISPLIPQSSLLAVKVVLFPSFPPAYSTFYQSAAVKLIN